MDEQKDLLSRMLAAARESSKAIADKAEELEAGQDLIGMEGAILEAVLRLGAAWLGLIVSQWGAHLADQTGTRLSCGCGGKARWVEQRAKTVLTLLGRVTYQRVYDHWAQCHNGEGLGDRCWASIRIAAKLPHGRILPSGGSLPHG